MSTGQALDGERGFYYSLLHNVEHAQLWSMYLELSNLTPLATLLYWQL